METSESSKAKVSNTFETLALKTSIVIAKNVVKVMQVENIAILKSILKGIVHVIIIMCLWVFFVWLVTGFFAFLNIFSLEILGAITTGLYHLVFLVPYVLGKFINRRKKEEKGKNINRNVLLDIERALAVSLIFVIWLCTTGLVLKVLPIQPSSFTFTLFLWSSFFVFCYFLMKIDKRWRKSDLETEKRQKYLKSTGIIGLRFPDSIEGEQDEEKLSGVLLKADEPDQSEGRESSKKDCNNVQL